MDKATQSVRAHRFETARAPYEREEILAVEEPLEIRVQGRSIAVTMRTPGHDEELTAGFLLSEGIVSRREDIIEMAHCRQGTPDTGNILNVFLAPTVTVNVESLSRHVFASSSCGICGKASIEAVRQQFQPISFRGRVSKQTLLSLPKKLREAQAVFDKTGALHAAGLFTLSGELISIREDVGRHNAVDKLIGQAWLNGSVPLSDHILLLSGRASFEITQKALAAAIPVIAAISAPSSLAVDFAAENGQTLVGFLREGGFNVYAKPDAVED